MTSRNCAAYIKKGRGGEMMYSTVENGRRSCAGIPSEAVRLSFACNRTTGWENETYAHAGVLYLRPNGGGTSEARYKDIYVVRDTPAMLMDDTPSNRRFAELTPIVVRDQPRLALSALINGRLHTSIVDCVPGLPLHCYSESTGRASPSVVHANGNPFDFRSENLVAAATSRKRPRIEQQ